MMTGTKEKGEYMKQFKNIAAVVFFFMMLAPLAALGAQAGGGKARPQVPITYKGDTDKTIVRRAQWIEAAKKEGTVIWWGSGNPKEINQIAAEFNKVYPFIKLNYWRGQDLERVTRFETEHAIGRVSFDIMEGGAPENFPRWREKGMPDKYTDIIPGIERWDRNSYSKYGDWTMPENTPMVPMYNTKLVSAAEAPKKWEDLLDPKWKGKIALTPDMKVWYMLAMDEKGWGIARTEDFLKRLKLQQPIWTQGHSAGHSLLEAGEFSIMGEDYFRYIFQSQKKGAPVNWCKVNPIPVPGSYYLLAKKGEHPNAARLFLEWFLSPQGLAACEGITGKGAAFHGAGTRQANALEGQTLIYKTEEMIVKAANLGLIDRFAKILGVTPE